MRREKDGKTRETRDHESGWEGGGWSVTFVSFLKLGDCDMKSLFLYLFLHPTPHPPWFVEGLKSRNHDPSPVGNPEEGFRRVKH